MLSRQFLRAYSSRYCISLLHRQSSFVNGRLLHSTAAKKEAQNGKNECNRATTGGPDTTHMKWVVEEAELKLIDQGFEEEKNVHWEGREGVHLHRMLALNPRSLKLNFSTCPADEPPPPRLFASASSSSPDVTCLSIENQVQFRISDQAAHNRHEWHFPTEAWIDTISGVLSACESLYSLRIKLEYLEYKPGDDLSDGWMDIYYHAIRAMSEHVLVAPSIKQDAAEIRVDFEFTKTTGTGNENLLELKHHPLLKLGRHVSGEKYSPRVNYWGYFETITRSVEVVKWSFDDKKNPPPPTELGVEGGGGEMDSKKMSEVQRRRRQKRGRVGSKTVTFCISRGDWTDDDDLEREELTSDSY